MKLILASIDGNLFDEGSYVRARMLEYAQTCERLEVVCVTSRTDAQSQRLSKNTYLHAVAGPKSLAPFRLFLLLRKLSGVLGSDTVLSSQDPFFLGLISLAAARSTGLPLHTQVHVAFFSHGYRAEGIKQYFLSQLAPFVLRRSARIRTVSQKITDHCVRVCHISPTRIDTIPLLVDLEKIRRSASLPTDADLRKRFPQFSQIVLMASRLTPQKNIPLAIEAFEKLHAQLPMAGLVIVGRGEEEAKIRALIKTKSLEHSVGLIPWSNDVPSLMKSADVLLISSDYEGYVMTAMEASACGLPVVMTDVGGAGEFVKEEVNGIIVPVGDLSALSEALHRVLTHPELQKRLSEGGLEQAAYLPTFSQYRDAIAVSWQKTLVPVPPRVLFITQTVDQRDLPLSFVHTWLEAFSGVFDRLTVIALNRGEYDLPGVEVLSLGKESGHGRFTYIVRLFSYAWNKRHDYDVVFVHMNQEYVLLAGWLWILMGKRVYLWHNHYSGSWWSPLVALMATKIFCTSKYAYMARYRKTVFMPVGVDTNRFFPDSRIVRVPRSILFFARITPSKRADVFIDALGLLLSKGISFVGSVYGSPYPKDVVYYESLKARAESLGLHDRVRFHPGVSNDKAPDIFRAHEIFVNCSPNGMLDKMIFEASACGALTLVASDDLSGGEYDQIHFEGPEELAEKLAQFLVPESGARVSALSALGTLVEKNTLTRLAQRIGEEVR